MSSSLIITGVVAGAGVTAYTTGCGKGFQADRATSLAITTTSTVAMGLGGTLMNHHTMDEIHQKYGSAYIESMSDEELVEALESLNLLAASSDEEKTSKLV